MFLNRNEGVSLIALIVLMVTMAVMGGVITSIMGGWKLSAPMSINSTKAFYLAETAAMFALQDAKYYFYGGFNKGTNIDPWEVASSTTEVADYWLEDLGTQSRYNIIATGRVKRGGATAAMRQIKIKATITGSPTDYIEPGVHTDGTIDGHGNAQNQQQINRAFDIIKGTSTVTFKDGDYLICDGDDDGIVYRPPQVNKDEIEVIFKAMSTHQVHNQDPPGGTWIVPDNYPPPSNDYYYSGSVPNIIYVDGNLQVNGGRTIYGVYWVTGSVDINGSARVRGIIICEGGNIDLHGGGSPSDVNINGGIIHYGGNTLQTDGNHIDININTGFFDALNGIIPVITVQSWQEAVSN